MANIPVIFFALEVHPIRNRFITNWYQSLNLGKDYSERVGMEVRMEILNAEIAEIKAQMKFTVEMTKSLEDAEHKSREEHQSSTERMLQTIMACFDAIRKGEGSEPKTIKQRIKSQSLKTGKMPVTNEVSS